jgi:hypothetical protein
MRFGVNKALRQWRMDLIQDLGGQDAISTQEEALVELAARNKFILDSIDNWLLNQPSLVLHNDKKVLPVVIQRQQLADGLARYMAQRGLSRRHKVESLNDILNHEEPEAHSSDNGKAEQAQRMADRIAKEAARALVRQQGKEKP